MLTSPSTITFAEVAELADAQASGVCGATRESSNLSSRTKSTVTLRGDFFFRLPLYFGSEGGIKVMQVSSVAFQCEAFVNFCAEEVHLCNKHVTKKPSPFPTPRVRLVASPRGKKGNDS